MLRREAGNWLARLQSGRDPDLERKFRRWHDADPRHAAAFDRVRRSYEQAGLLRHSRLASAASRHSRPGTPARSPSPRLALAAGIALAVFVPAGVLLVAGVLPLSGTSAMVLVTRVGEIRQVELADGSKVTLDTATKIDVEVGRSRRTAHLRYGRARFQIAQANAPFVVETGKSKIMTRQGVVDVEQGAQQDRVLVLAGAAEVRGTGREGASPVAIAEGESLTVNSGGAGQKGVAAPAPDWTRGMLQFDGTPLVDAVALANRYSERHIILLGVIGGLRVTGGFRAGDTLGLAKALAAAFDLSLQQRTGDDLVLSRKSPSTPRK